MNYRWLFCLLLTAFVPSCGDGVGNQLRTAIQQGNDQMITQESVDAARNTGALLLIAMDAGEKETYRHLLYLGADPNQFTSSGRAPIHLAAFEDDSYWLSMCLSHGGNPNLVRPNVSDLAFETPVECAARSGQVENLGLLLDAGGDIELEDPVDGTPLYCSAKSAEYQTMLLLLERGAKYSREEQPYFISLIESRIRVYREMSEQEAYSIDPYFIKVVSWLEEQGVVLEKD